jgi:hypothetical protein
MVFSSFVDYASTGDVGMGRIAEAVFQILLGHDAPKDDCFGDILAQA